MWVQNLLILIISTAALARPVPRPTPISVYQQEDLEEQQQPLQQYRQQPLQLQQQYKQQQPRPAARLLKNSQQQLQQTESEDYEMSPPQPYQFSFDVNDDENTNYQNRKEQREGNKISGSYSVVDSDGFIRTVTYTADPVEGFKAHVSREPTNIVVKIPAPHEEQGPLAGPNSQIQYNGAPAARGAQLRPQQQAQPLPRRQQTQQYLQATQDSGDYQQPQQYHQGTVRVSQAIAQGGQVNQYLAQTSPQSSQLGQYSNSNTALRG